MRLSTKTITIIGIFVVTLLVAFWLAARQEKPTTKTPSPSPNAGTAPREIPALISGPIQNKQPSVRFVLSFPPISVPETLPVYSTKGPDMTASWTTIAQNLGFSGPGTSPKGQPTMRWWINSAGTLKVYSSPPSVAFTAQRDLVGPPTEIEANGALSAFVSKTGILGGAISFVPTPVQYVTVGGSSYLPAPDKTKASMAIASLDYRINNMPLYATSGLPYEAVGQVHAGGALRSAMVPAPPIILSSAEKQTIALSAAATHLSNNKGTLVSIRASTPGETSISEINFSAVLITKASLVYLYVNRAEQILPVYLFEGSVTSGEGDSRGAIAVFFVPATYN